MKGNQRVCLVRRTRQVRDTNQMADAAWYICHESLNIHSTCTAYAFFQITDQTCLHLNAFLCIHLIKTLARQNIIIISKIN